MNHVKFSLSLLLSLSVSAVCAMEAPKANDVYVAPKSELAPVKSLAWAKNAPNTWVKTELDQISTAATTEEHPLAIMQTLTLTAAYKARLVSMAQIETQEKELAARKKAELVQLEGHKFELMRRHNARFMELEGNCIAVSLNEKAIKALQAEQEKLAQDNVERTQISQQLLEQYENLGAQIAQAQAEISAATPAEVLEEIKAASSTLENKPTQTDKDATDAQAEEKQEDVKPTQKSGWLSYFKRS